MKLHCLGSGREVGRSCFLLETDQRVLLDYGLKIFSKEGKKKTNMFPIPYQGSIDAVFLSHAHLDHSGFLPEIYTRPFVHWFGTPPTLDISSILWNDSLKIMKEEAPYRKVHISRAESNWAPMLYGQNLSLGDTTYTLHDAGHIAGSSMVRATHKGKSLVYSGDFNTADTRMHKGAKAPENVDYLIMESTYSDRDHPPREEAERNLIRKVEKTVDEGGTALLPAFALGRSQELLAVLHAHLRGIPVYLDGMSKAITRIYLKYDSYLKDHPALQEASESTIFVENSRDRRDATREPGVIVSTAGMMEGGPALSYLLSLSPNSRIIFTGYNVEGTNGWKILNKGKVTIDKNDLDVSIPSEYIDFSAHAGRKELLSFAKKANPEKIILNHGDKTQHFAEELREMGFDALAPANGDSLDLP
jgi:putative mRNA 3-end processing factor